MNSIIDNKLDNELFWKEEMDRCKSPLFFYENYATIKGERPVVYDKDKAFLKMIDIYGHIRDNANVWIFAQKRNRFKRQFYNCRV